MNEFFCCRKFTVIDLETTGLNYTPANGNVDNIIEVGAVRIL
jgi:DNA polymerase III epsilon subunit-like protein